MYQCIETLPCDDLPY